MDEIVWTAPALQDLDDIAAYIALEDPKAAETVTRRIVDTRELLVGETPYIVVCRIKGENPAALSIPVMLGPDPSIHGEASPTDAGIDAAVPAPLRPCVADGCSDQVRA